jgi:UDP-N-acetylglucosamine 2-epimerase (non-hydrolysing)
VESNSRTDRLNAVFVIGTRPEAIKMLPLVLAFRASSHFTAIVVSTGQHRDMVREVLALGGIEPDVEFSGGHGRTLNRLFGDVMRGMEGFLNTFGAERIDFGEVSEGYPVAVFVHGDTSSAAAAALAAFHMRIPVVHVEAGLRTDNTLSPFPEELNRQLISRIASLHLAPTLYNEENLIREGIPHGKVFVCGNTAIDALRIVAEIETPYESEELADLEHDTTTRVVVVTAHRRENWGEPLERIGRAVHRLSERFEDVRFVVPVHPNPVIGEALRRHLSGSRNITLVPAMSYATFSRLLARSHFVITDSGGIQEEAPALGKPVLVMRDTTDRTEGVDAGTVQLVGTDIDRILDAASLLLVDGNEYRRRSARQNPYGDGHAAERILAACEHIVFNSRPPVPYGPQFDRRDVLRSAGFQDDPAEELEWFGNE